MDDVVIINFYIEVILENEDWIEDVLGFMFYCIVILKICYILIEKFVVMMMGFGVKMKILVSVSDIIVVVKWISFRVDDVVKLMYFLLDFKFLDVWIIVLFLFVSYLVLVIRNVCYLMGGLDWID